jgi:hypothetical protein
MSAELVRGQSPPQRLRDRAFAVPDFGDRAIDARLWIRDGSMIFRILWRCHVPLLAQA